MTTFIVKKSSNFIYGTSGFRAKATMLNDVVRRTAYYAAKRANNLEKSIGLMITASHNPVQDNGIKLIDWNGRMLPIWCENELTEIVNACVEEFKLYIEKVGNDSNKNEKGKGMVIIGTDTRPSSPKLLQEAILGVAMFGNGITAKIFKSHTTPQLHFIVRAFNDNSWSDGVFISSFRNAFADSLKLIPFRDCDPSSYDRKLFVDCANGVGALWVKNYLMSMPTVEVFVNNYNVLDRNVIVRMQVIPLILTLLNDQTDNGELLNNGCGADFVKIQTELPANFETIPIGSKCASLDGDADRLIYFYPNGNGKQVSLLDGDHISALFAKFIKHQFNEAERIGQPIPLTFGIVQTAYANGNSTRYFTKELGLKPILTKTGVKYLEEEAHKFDIGIYFEANGHGTVCFSEKFNDFIRDYFEIKLRSSEVPLHIELLSLFSKLVNKVVGDGIADLLAVECLLRYFDWSIQDWELNTYKNMPNVQLKVPIKDRFIYSTAEDNETKLVRPPGKQENIDKIVEEFPGSRAFIRPSGTEKIVRIYAEAQTQEEANKLANQLTQLIK